MDDKHWINQDKNPFEHCNTHCNLQMSWQFNVPIINLCLWAAAYSHFLFQTCFDLYEPALWCRTQRFLSGPFSPGVEISAQVLVVSNDGRLLFSGGHWDCSLRVTQLGKGKLVGRICRHIGELTCLISKIYVRFVSHYCFIIVICIFMCSTKMLLLAWLWISVASTSSLVQGTHPV